jgi:hypothetical protein
MTDEPDATTADEPERKYERGEQDAIHSGVKLRAKVKRGTGTRDQDVMLIEARGADAEEAADDFEDALSRAESEDWGDRLRALQPEENDDE